MLESEYTQRHELETEKGSHRADQCEGKAVGSLQRAVEGRTL